MRLVLIVGKTYTVYEGKRCIATFEVNDEIQRLPTLEEIEEIRTANYEIA